MNISLRWLSDYVDSGLPPEDIAERLTMAGLEVEEVVTTGPALDGVVVGRVLDVRPHPDADRLQVCDVDLAEDADGDSEPVQIVCGAPNVAAGQRVPVATVGTELMLPARDGSGLEPVTIKKGKIRGQVSNGMICAEDELGLGDSHDGILVLDPAAPVGLPLIDWLRQRGELPGDTVLDIAITPNRPDATSHVGVARDLAALTATALVLPDVSVPEAGGPAADAVTVRIEDPDGCPRYAAMVVRGVTVGPSPDWMQERLRAVGVRPINNVVDVTNYVLHEIGQPLHAFDLDQLAESTVVVRASRPGETVRTLDDRERKLPEGTLLICDAERPVAVAGVMGGADSEVSDATTSVLIESAAFDPARVRRASKALGLQTDASYRFERGVDRTRQPWAAARAAALLAELAGGEVVPGLIDEVPRPYRARTVTVRPSRVARVLGTEVPADEVVRLLTAIGFEVETDRGSALEAFAEAALQGTVAAAVEEAGDAGLTVTVPPFRPDVEREVDVIEEVARLWGYDRLPTPASTPVPLVPAGDTPSARLLGRARQRLAALGFREIATNSLVPTPTAHAFADAAWTGLDAPPVETLNPISQEMSALRPSLLTGLVAVASYNQARGAGALRLFEAGHVYRRSADASEPVAGYHEHTSLVLGMSGLAERASWDAEARRGDVYDLKGVVLDLLADLGIDDVHEAPRPAPDGLTAYALDLHVADPARGAGGTRVGALGRLADSFADGAELQDELFVAELDWDAVARLARRDQPPAYRPISRFPTVERDLALVVPEAQPAGPLLDTIRQSGRPLLQGVRLFDLYQGEGIPDGTKSLAFTLRFGAGKTLRDQEVDGRVRRVVQALEAEHGATLRS